MDTLTPELAAEIARHIEAFALPERDYDPDDRSYSPQEAASVALFIIGEPAITPLIQALSGSNPNVRRWAAETLRLLGSDKAADIFLEIIKNPDEKGVIRSEATAALGELQDQRATEPLIDYLGNGNDAFSLYSTISALGKLKNDKAFNALMKLFTSDRDGSAKSSIARALGEIANPAAYDALAQAIKTDNIQLQLDAGYALAELKDPRAFSVLASLLEAENADTVRYALSPLARLGDSRAYELIKAKWGERYGIFNRDVVLALGYLGDKRAFEFLAEKLNEGTKYDSLMVALALGDLGDLRAVDLLLSKIDEKRGEVNPYAAIALGHLKDPRAFKPLVNVMNHSPDWWLARCAATGLGELGDLRAVDHLLQEINSESEEMRFNVCEALGKLGDPGTLPFLEKLALTDFEETADVQGGPDRVCDAAVEAIWNIRRKQKGV